MKIGFLGAGTVAQTIARHVLPHGHKVLLSNTKGPDSLASVVEKLGAGASAGTPQEAASQDLVVLAVGWAKCAAGAAGDSGLEGSDSGGGDRSIKADLLRPGF